MPSSETILWGLEREIEVEEEGRPWRISSAGVYQV